MGWKKPVISDQYRAMSFQNANAMRSSSAAMPICCANSRVRKETGAPLSF